MKNDLDEARGKEGMSVPHPLSDAEIRAIRLALSFTATHLDADGWKSIARGLLVTLDAARSRVGPEGGR